MYVPAPTLAFVIAASPLWPEIVVGPVALSVQAVASAVPPPVLSTVLARVRWAGWAAPGLQSVAGFGTDPDPQVVEE